MQPLCIQAAGYSAPRTRGPRAPVTVARLPGCRWTKAQASQANASASTCSGGTPRSEVLCTFVAGNSAAERFWHKCGYREVRTREITNASGKPRTVRVLVKLLAACAV